MDHEAKRAVAMRCADRLVGMRYLDGRRVHHQHRADNRDEETSKTAATGCRLRLGHDLGSEFSVQTDDRRAWGTGRAYLNCSMRRNSTV